ncbi:Hypothetical protein HEAR2312 [Herminiimonas arsenicoxydans]|uniref:Uncharacterized protein n=1 Tax=Herminiimonas arsenicoxydans TaxID=204773 RepID=A4G7F6_HERAR|nr:Hypothetical protein HEAR2312 [Herminiimonas arsenicoxydans]
MSTSPIKLPKITDDDLSILHYNPNTSDVIEWIHDYARQAIAQTAPAVAGEAIPTYTTGHCEYNKQPGGCQQHNLHCGWPACDQRALAAKKG